MITGKTNHKNEAKTNPVELSIRIAEKNGEFVASCPELDVHCFGPSREKASARLKTVIKFYFDSAQENEVSWRSDTHEMEANEVILH